MEHVRGARVRRAYAESVRGERARGTGQRGATGVDHGAELDRVGAAAEADDERARAVALVPRRHRADGVAVAALLAVGHEHDAGREAVVGEGRIGAHLVQRRGDGRQGPAGVSASEDVVDRGVRVGGAEVEEATPGLARVAP